MSLDDDIKALEEKYGIKLTPDTGHGPHHRTIVNKIPILNTKTGFFLTLECGHMSQSFGNLEHARGKVYCAACAAEAQ